jgi:hypothetical protein
LRKRNLKGILGTSVDSNFLNIYTTLVWSYFIFLAFKLIISIFFSILTLKINGIMNCMFRL